MSKVGAGALILGGLVLWSLYANKGGQRPAVNQSIAGSGAISTDPITQAPDATDVIWHPGPATPSIIKSIKDGEIITGPIPVVIPPPAEVNTVSTITITSGQGALLGIE